jgi:hypothetical protein
MENLKQIDYESLPKPKPSMQRKKGIRKSTEGEVKHVVQTDLQKNLDVK